MNLPSVKAERTHPTRRSTAATRPHAAAPRSDAGPSGRSAPVRLLWALGAAVALLLVLPASGGLAAYAAFRLSDRIAPGVTVGGAPIEWRRLAEATADLDRIWNQEFTLTVLDTSDTARVWIARPSEFGLAVDPASSAALAWQVGRASNWFEGLGQLYRGLRQGIDVSPIVTFDPAGALAGLEAWEARVSIPSVEASLEVREGSVVQSAGQRGKALDVEATLRMLSADPAAILLTYRFVPLVTAPVSPRIAEAAPAAAQAERLLGASPTLRAYDPVTGEDFRWSPSRQEVASWLRIGRAPTAFEVSVDETRLREYLDELNVGLGPERGFDLEEGFQALSAGLNGDDAGPLMIHYRPTTVVVGPRDTWVSIAFQVGLPYWKIAEANPEAASRGLTPGETIRIPPRDAMLRLPVVVNKRIVISIGEQRLWVYQDGELVDDFVISTGISSSPTLPGIFQVQSHILNAYASIWDLYMPHFLGIYEAVPGFWNGIHGLPLLSNGRRLWANVLGRPASYGCIILDLQSAEWLYGWAEEGVVAEIRR